MIAMKTLFLIHSKFNKRKRVSNIKRTIRKKLKNYGDKYVDYRMGMAGAVVMASIVFSINYIGTDNLLGATTAALKQGTYTFFFGGVITKMSERLSTEIKRKVLALIAACLIPSMVSITLTFGMHNLKGTPKPLESTIPTAVMVIPSTFIWGLINRRKMEKQSDNLQNEAIKKGG
jgi:hypothetical protein